MAVDPHSLTVSRCPMSWPPDVIGPAHVITRATNVVRPIANLDGDGARITSSIIRSAVIRSTIIGFTIIRPVARRGAIIPFAPRCTERDGDQNQHEQWPSHFSFCPTLCGNCSCIRRINDICLHTFIIRITRSFYAPVFIETASARVKKTPHREAIIRHLGRASRRRLLRSL